MLMPRRPAQLFRSRWSALWWALGVLVTAMMTVGFGDPAPSVGNANATATVAAPVDALGQPVDDADLKALAAVLNGS